MSTLTPKQETFCTHYTTIGSETFGNGTRSAIEAGYADNIEFQEMLPDFTRTRCPVSCLQ
ncbi:hypothetical protein ACFL3F_01685 [Planctomycetota bacterium]